MRRAFRRTLFNFEVQELCNISLRRRWHAGDSELGSNLACADHSLVYKGIRTHFRVNSVRRAVLRTLFRFCVFQFVDGGMPLNSVAFGHGICAVATACAQSG